MSQNVAELNEGNFDKETKKGKWIIDLWAVWCNPCKIMAPYLEAAAKELKGKVNFAKVNVDENYNLTERFEVRAVPTTLFMKDGQVVHVSTGVLTKDQILELARENFKS